jgi:putative DNA primase/helicase
MDATEQFRAAIIAGGLNPPDVIEIDGKLHRFPSNGKRGDDAGWYVFYANGIPAGAFGDWRTGLSQTWRADIGRALSPAEEAGCRAKIESAKRERQADEAKLHAEAGTKAVATWKTAQDAGNDHPYLVGKGVTPVPTLREIPVERAAAILGYVPKAKGEALIGRLLVVPVKIGDWLSTLELIDEAGRKSALAGGAKRGGYWAAQPLEGERDSHCSSAKA